MSTGEGPTQRPTSKRPSSPRARTSGGENGSTSTSPPTQRTSTTSRSPNSASPTLTTTARAAASPRSLRNSGTDPRLGRNSGNGSFFAKSEPASPGTPPLARAASGSRLLSAKPTAAGSSPPGGLRKTPSPQQRAASPRSGPRILSARSDSSSSNRKSTTSSLGTPGSNRSTPKPLTVSTGSPSSPPSSSSSPLSPSSPRRLNPANHRSSFGNSDKKAPPAAHAEKTDGASVAHLSVRERLALRRGSSRDIGALQRASTDKGKVAGETLDGRGGQRGVSTGGSKGGVHEKSKTQKQQQQQQQQKQGEAKKFSSGSGGSAWAAAAVVEPGGFERMGLPSGLDGGGVKGQEGWRQHDNCSLPTPLIQSGYTTGFLEAQSIDLHLHILGATTALNAFSPSTTSLPSPSSTLPASLASSPLAPSTLAPLSLSSFEPYLRLFPLSSGQGEGGGGHMGKFSTRCAAKGATAPTWREEFSLFGVELDEELCMELRTKARDGKALRMGPSVCSLTFCVGDIMAALANLHNHTAGGGGGGDLQRVKFILGGDEGSATVNAVVSFSKDHNLVLKGFHSQNTAPGGGGRAPSHHKTGPRISLNNTNSCLLLTPPHAP